MKNLALALGLEEDATEKEIKNKAEEMNLEIVDGKLKAKAKDDGEDPENSAGDDEDDDEAMKASYSKNPGKHIHALHKKVAKMEEDE